MQRRIPQEVREEINRLYNDGLRLSEIARQTGVSYPSVYGMTRARQKVNPETGEPFESYTAYRKHLARQKVNPETGEPFKSRTEYEAYHARQRINRNKGLGNLIREILEELGQNQSWLAKQLGVSRQAVSNYIQGRLIPGEDKVERLLQVIRTNYKTSPTSLDDLVEE